MEEPFDALKRHYEQQRIPEDRVASILAAGRAQAAMRRRRRRTYWLSAMAAVLVVGVGLAKWKQSTAVSQSVSAPLRLTDLSSSVVQFFNTPSSALGQLSPKVSSLQQWLEGKGAPSAFNVPPTLGTLQSLGCQVLEVRGQHVSLLCFLLDGPPPEVAPESSSTPSNAKANAPTSPPRLVHLLVAPRSAFTDAPRVGERVQLDPNGNWNFVAWSDKELVFVAASDVPGQPLSTIGSAL
jgi:hypothetical protein